MQLELFEEMLKWVEEHNKNLEKSQALLGVINEESLAQVLKTEAAAKATAIANLPEPSYSNSEMADLKSQIGKIDFSIQKPKPKMSDFSDLKILRNISLQHNRQISTKEM